LVSFRTSPLAPPFFFSTSGSSIDTGVSGSTSSSSSFLVYDWLSSVRDDASSSRSNKSYGTRNISYRTEQRSLLTITRLSLPACSVLDRFLIAAAFKGDSDTDPIIELGKVGEKHGIPDVVSELRADAVSAMIECRMDDASEWAENDDDTLLLVLSVATVLVRGRLLSESVPRRVGNMDKRPPPTSFLFDVGVVGAPMLSDLSTRGLSVTFGGAAAAACCRLSVSISSLHFLIVDCLCVQKTSLYFPSYLSCFSSWNLASFSSSSVR